MAVILALEQLYTNAVVQFGEEGTFGATPDPITAAQRANTFGWREPAHQGGPTTRIVWKPGDPSENVGGVGAPQYPGRIDPGRPLATLNELFTVWLVAFDPTAPENEFAQWKATRLLYDAWFRVVYLVSQGSEAGSGKARVTVQSQAWEQRKTWRRFGATIRVVGSIEAMIPDTKPIALVGAVGGSFNLTELDQTENVTVQAPTPPVTDDAGDPLTDNAGEILTNG